MSSYDGRHAELYDFFYTTKPYHDEALFVHQCLQTYGRGGPQRLLELACGTGEHAFALESFGYHLLAIDYSEDMLAQATRKAAGRASTVEFRAGDMRRLDVPEHAFDAVICLFDSIGYVATNDALLSVLQGVSKGLRMDGFFIFEFWHAGAMLKSYDPVRIRRWATPEGDILRIAETSLDCGRQLGTVTYTVYELRHDGTYRCFKETQINRYFLVQEMAGWLTAAGFLPLQWFDGFRQQTDITVETWHVLCVARKVKDL